MMPRLFFTSKVFTLDEIGSNQKIDRRIRKSIQEYWEILNQIAEIKIINERHPTNNKLRKELIKFDPNIIGCHLTHRISQDMQKSSSLFAISTSTAGYNHILRLPEDNILITNTPGVLHKTVADYTITLIMASLRNLIDLHNYVWNGNWSKNSKWDIDQQLSSMIRNKVVGIVGLGEIGSEVLKLLNLMGVKVIYYDLRRRFDLEDKYPSLEYISTLTNLFKKSDVITLHVPQNENTKNFINLNQLRLMKSDSLIVNTARGGVLNLDDLLNLLESGEKRINFALDVFPEEPINKKILLRIKKLKLARPNLRFLLMPHNASSDANTRGEMVKIFLSDIVKLIKSRSLEDLTDVNIIPVQKLLLDKRKWKIEKYWDYQVD